MNKNADDMYRAKRLYQRVKNLYHLLVAVLANLRYGFPSRQIKVIGVTGTDGKTTTANLIYHILKSAGKPVSLISTVYAQVGGVRYETGLHTTNPDAIQTQRLIRKAVQHGDEYMVFETTSHGIDQHRVFGVQYYLGVITNVTHEHLDYHYTYKHYLDTKTKLLLWSQKALVNKDDVSYVEIKKTLRRKNHHFFTYGVRPGADFCLDKTRIAKNTPRFNRFNFCAAYAVGRMLGISEEVIYRAMASFRLPNGRWELVYDRKFKILIDFAHTPNAFKNLLPEVREKLLGNGRLIHVFGAAGLRDHTKRYQMGKTSGSYSDVIILTEEDYRTESLYNICEQIGKGIHSVNKDYTIINNRLDAIEKAIKIAQDNDVVVLTGKAHEQSLCRHKTEYPWNEKAAVMKTLKHYDLL